MKAELAVRGEEAMPPAEVAKEVARLITDFRTRHPDLTSFHQERTRLLWEKSADRESLRVSRTTDDGTESIILVIDKEMGGGIHFIEANKGEEPVTYGHTYTAIKKIEEFLKDFRQALNAS